MEEKEKTDHPSYVLVSFSRRSGNPGVLYGSDLVSHESYMTLRISRSERHVSGIGEEHHYGSLRGDVVEVDMSNAQFAELITTMNIGLGTPGTLSLLNGEKVERDVVAKSPAQRISDAQESRVKELVADAKSLTEHVRSVFAKKGNILQTERAEILKRLSMFSNRIADNQGWMITIFQEATEKIKTAAKTEIDAFFSSTRSIHKALQGKESITILELPSKEKSDE